MKRHVDKGRKAKRLALLLASLPLTINIAPFCSPARAEDPAAGSPLYDPLSHPLSAEYSIAPLDPRLSEFKKALLDLGYNFQVNFTQEALGNPSGGAQQGATYEGLVELGVDGDLDRIAGLKGASFHINAFGIFGRGLSTYNIFNLMTVSNIEARRTMRLDEFWFEQDFGFGSIRLGQLAADTEFLAGDFDTLYWNGAFGWPSLTTSDLPGTGPGYPLATPGIRLKIKAEDHVTLLLGLFNGDPSGSGFNVALSEIDNCCGINFRLRDPPLLIGQAEFTYTLPVMAQGLAGKVRIGGWHHFGQFNDQFFSSDGLPLADPKSTGIPAIHLSDQAAYGIIDQMIWRAPGDDPWKGVGFFVFGMTSPPDRNFLTVEVEAGVNFMGLWDKRPHDSFGAAFCYDRISPFVSASDQVAASFSNGFVPVRNYELMVEATYQAQIMQGFTVQPDFQYVFHPGGGAIDPLNPRVGRIPDAAVFGLRTVVKF